MHSNKIDHGPDSLEFVSCDLCGENRYRVRYEKPDNWLWLDAHEYSVVKCRHCGLVYVNPRPSQDEIERFYPPGYHEDRDVEEFLMRYEQQLRFIPSIPSGHVLDIGCAKGDWLVFLEKRFPGIKMTGVDLFSDGVNSADIRFIKSGLLEAGLEEDAFDLITAWAVFEHLHNPKDHFEKVSQLLKKEGRFVMLVTNAESFYGTAAYMEDVPRHLYHFSESTLTRYAKETGLVMRKCTYDDSIWDGRGVGSFYYSLSFMAGLNWKKIRENDRNTLQRLAGKVGRMLDAMVFRYSWEAKLRRSGIVIAEFERRR